MNSTHLVTCCPDCSQTYRIRYTLLGEGVRVRCRTCASVFEVQSDVRPLEIWLFDDDPAFSRDGSVAAFHHPFHKIIRFGRAERVSRMAVPGGEPDLIVFGDLHVILEDPLLKKVATGGATRVLVSTHRNDEMLETARAFCGYDQHLVLPLDPTVVDVVLGDALEERARIA